MNNQAIPTHLLIDCRGTGIALMDQSYPLHQLITKQQLQGKWQIQNINRTPIESVDCQNLAKIGMKIQYRQEQLPMFVTKLGYYSVVLGIPWCRVHDITIWFVQILLILGHKMVWPITMMPYFQLKELQRNPWTQFISQRKGYLNH